MFTVPLAFNLPYWMFLSIFNKYTKVIQTQHKLDVEIELLDVYLLLLVSTGPFDRISCKQLGLK